MTPAGFRHARKFLRLLLSFSCLLILIVFFAILVGDISLSTTAPFVEVAEKRRFLTVNNFQTIAVQNAIIALCGIGMTLVIISGGIDLSVASTLALSAAAAALAFEGKLAKELYATVFLGRWWMAGLVIAAFSITTLLSGTWRLRPFLQRVAFLAVIVFAFALSMVISGPIGCVWSAIVFGGFTGLVIGFLVNQTRVAPFVITLGMMTIVRGLVMMLTHRSTVNVDSARLAQSPWLESILLPPDLSNSTGWITWLQHAHGVYLVIGLGVLIALLLNFTTLGRYMYAIGSNEKAAILSGVNVRGTKYWVYGLAGMLVGLAGVLQMVRLGQADPTTSQNGSELSIIAAVVIGGASLRGGEGSVLGTFLGTMIMGILESGSTIANIPLDTQRLLIGVVIILAVTFDEWRRQK